MEKQIVAINNSHQSDTKVATNKGKSVYIDPPDDSPKMDMNTEITNQSKDALSTPSPPSLPITENSSSSSSTASPNFPLASHAQKPVKPTNSRLVIPPICQAPKDDKGLNRIVKEQNGSCMLIGYFITWDALSHRISHLQQWKDTDLAWCRHSTSSYCSHNLKPSSTKKDNLPNDRETPAPE
ncbi:hypothetical protein RCL_jg29237.t1 [Rhizophagus clarus]|uniref:Uncharacterized protein n=1 Tax=Rhizophagus clarus TaxID=94130 RepID=A0A8H3MA97_9GLOM|nr:hypothetical protein RCL_jg29237.t1 [Rhizophagus clarus]